MMMVFSGKIVKYVVGRIENKKMEILKRFSVVFSHVERYDSNVISEKD
jgi:hypothetical protein